MKRRQESEPAFISASPERSKLPLDEKRERRKNSQSIIFYEERLALQGVGNLPQSHNKKK